MSTKRFLAMLALMSVTVIACARVVTDTLESKKGDRVYVDYAVKRDGRRVEIRFLNVSPPKLGRTFGDKYDSRDVVVVFFDRRGDFGDGLQFTGEDVETLMVPGGVSYRKSTDGYFFLTDGPTISVEVETGGKAQLSIPCYLACEVKRNKLQKLLSKSKTKYEVFSRFENLQIALSAPAAVADQTSTTIQTEEQTYEEQIVADDSDLDARAARNLMDRLRISLAEADELPLSTQLENDYSSLCNIRDRSTDESLNAQIDAVLAEYRSKEAGLKEANRGMQAKAEEEAERQRQAEIARQDSIARADKERADKERRQNLWMMAGAALLAVVGFVVQQVFKRREDAKNRNIIKSAQDNATKLAEREARRARSMAQGQMRRAQGEASQNVRNTLKGSLGKFVKGKGNKGVSI